MPHPRLADRAGRQGSADSQSRSQPRKYCFNSFTVSAGRCDRAWRGRRQAQRQCRDDGPDGDQARARLRGEHLVLPELADLEVTSILRRQIRAAASTSGAQASHWTIRRAARPAGTTPPPAPPMLEPRDNLTIYHAAYMALAEAMDATLLTGDRRLARAPGPGAPPRSSSPHPDPCQSRPPHRQARLPRATPPTHPPNTDS